MFQNSRSHSASTANAMDMNLSALRYEVIFLHRLPYFLSLSLMTCNFLLIITMMRCHGLFQQNDPKIDIDNMYNISSNGMGSMMNFCLGLEKAILEAGSMFRFPFLLADMVFVHLLLLLYMIPIGLLDLRDGKQAESMRDDVRYIATNYPDMLTFMSKVNISTLLNSQPRQYYFMDVARACEARNILAFMINKSLTERFVMKKANNFNRPVVRAYGMLTKRLVSDGADNLKNLEDDEEKQSYNSKLSY